MINKFKGFLFYYSLTERVFLLPINYNSIFLTSFYKIVFVQVETSAKLGDDKSTSNSIYSTDGMSSTSTEVPSLPVEQTKQSVDQDPSPDSGASPTLSINSLGIV